MNSSSLRFGPQREKIKKTASHRQNNKVKEVGTPPVPSNLCSWQGNLLCQQLCGTESQRPCPEKRLFRIKRVR